MRHVTRWMSHVTHMNASCHTYEWDTNWRVYTPWISVTYMNESCLRYECVTSHLWMSHVPHINASCHTYKCVMSHVEWVMSHVWMSHVTHMNASCHTYEWDTNWRVYTPWKSVTHMNESCLRYECDVIDCLRVSRLGHQWGFHRSLFISYRSLFIYV